MFIRKILNIVYIKYYYSRKHKENTFVSILCRLYVYLCNTIIMCCMYTLESRMYIIINYFMQCFCNCVKNASDRRWRKVVLLCAWKRRWGPRLPPACAACARS